MADDDPLVMYFAVNGALGMSPGKIAAQVGHGVQYLMMTYQLRDRAEPPEMTSWLNGDSRKVVLVATAAEWAELKAMSPGAMVTDDGHTEVSPGSETVLAFWPLRKSERPPLLKRLRAL